MVICITYKIPFSLKSIKGVHYPFLESKKEGKGKESEMGGRMARRRGIQVHYLRENKDRMDYKHVKKVLESNHQIIKQKQFAILA